MKKKVLPSGLNLSNIFCLFAFTKNLPQASRIGSFCGKLYCMLWHGRSSLKTVGL